MIKSEILKTKIAALEKVVSILNSYVDSNDFESLPENVSVEYVKMLSDMVLRLNEYKHVLKCLSMNLQDSEMLCPVCNTPRKLYQRMCFNCLHEFIALRPDGSIRRFFE